MTYSNSLAAGRQKYASNGRNTAVYGGKAGIGPVSNTIILIILACLLGLLYLTQVTRTNAYGFRISDLKEQQTRLKEENDDLNIAAARLQALDQVKNSEAAKNLVSVVPSATVR